MKVLTGKDKGKSGTVLRAMPKRDLIVVEGIAIHKRHEKPRQQGKKGSIVERPGPIHVSNVTKA